MTTQPGSPEAGAAPAFPVERVRARFSGAREQAYLDVASRSLVPDSALEIAHRHLLRRVQGRADKKHYFALVEEARTRFARAA